MNITRTAEFSNDRKYRYFLNRQWNTTLAFVAFIALNPSTADEDKDDRTATRCINFAKDWGYGGVCMVNLFAYFNTDPKVMMRQYDPRGPDNDYWLKKIAVEAGLLIAAWGNDGTHRNRNLHVLQLLEGFKLHHMGLTKLGQPRHPLYLKNDTEVIEWTH